MITVSIPVGPYPWYKTFLQECLESVAKQTQQATHVVLVDDMANLEPKDTAILGESHIPFTIWRSPWRLGIPAVANIAYALAPTDLAFQLSCDDRLMPTCLEMCQAEWDKRQDSLGFYWVDIQYSTGETQALPCGHAMVHKALWRHTGGYPVEAGVGACDHIFMNMALLHPNDVHLYEVPGGPLYWHREHPEQYTKHQNVNQSTIADVRTIYGQRWEPQEGKWGRYEP
jgi:hypothetical protein